MPAVTVRRELPRQGSSMRPRQRILPVGCAQNVGSRLTP
jgi:hypothetical protein